MKTIKISFLLFIVAGLFSLSSCSDKENPPPKPKAQNNLLGNYVSTLPSEGYFQLTITKEHILYTVGQETVEWKDYTIENGNILKVYRSEIGNTERKAFYKHPITYETNGNIRLGKFQRDDTLIAPALGDNSQGFHDVVFKKIAK